jgi:hypothetical protein
VRIRYKDLPMIKNSNSLVLYEESHDEKGFEKNIINLLNLISEIRTNLIFVSKPTIDLAKDRNEINVDCADTIVPLGKGDRVSIYAFFCYHL